MWEKTELDTLLEPRMDQSNSNIQQRVISRGIFRNLPGRNFSFKRTFQQSETDRFSSLRKILFKEREKRYRSKTQKY